MKLEDTLRRLLDENGAYLQEALVFSALGHEYWQCSVIDLKGAVRSTGFGNSIHSARKIALVELLERNKGAELFDSSQQTLKKWGLDLVPTLCGFAAGMDKRNTLVRSVHEATERWVMSKWVNDQLYIEQLSSEAVCQNLDPLSLFLVSQFQEVRFYLKTVLVALNDKLIPVNVAQTVGLSECGAFPGASSQTTGGNLWQHALLESYRHLLFAHNNRGPAEDFLARRIKFFAENKEAALAQIPEPNGKKWPLAKVRLHNTESFSDGKYYLSRTILEGWKSWHEGPLSRFLY